MTRKEKAMALHKSGYNCAQSVIAACADLVGIDEELALNISAGFGGGLRSGEVCGFISGAMMALSLSMPSAEVDSENKDKVAAAAKEFCAAVKEKYGALRCDDLLANRDKKEFCNPAIGEITEMVEQIILANK